MNRIALEAAILGLFVYTPLILYGVWSWRWLRAHSADMRDGRTWLGILPMSMMISVIWCVVASIASGFIVLSTYNLRGEEAEFADTAFTIAFLPAEIVSGIIELLPGVPIYYKAELLYWLLVTVIIAVFLLTISFIEWLFIQRIYVRPKAQSY